jgi:hypothetical protein
MQAKFALVVLLLDTFTVISAANAQPAAVTGGATGQSSPAAGKALVYVYRPPAHGSLAFSGARLLRYAQVFVNGDFLAELENSNYASTQVPPGALAFTSWWSFKDTVAPGFQSVANGEGALGQYFPPVLRWPRCVGKPKKPSCSFDAPVQSPEEGNGCASVNWRRAGEARSEDVALCKYELAMTTNALENWVDPDRKRRDLILGLLVPGMFGAAELSHALRIPGGDLSAWLQMCGPKPFPSPSPQEAGKLRLDLAKGDYSGDFSRCWNGLVEAARVLSQKELLRIDVEAGKTYYVKWHVPYKPGTPLPKMVLVDEAAGAAEISALHAAQ